MLITHWRGAIIFYLQVAEPSRFHLSAPSWFKEGLRPPCTGKEAVGATDPLAGHPSSAQQAAPGRAGTCRCGPGSGTVEPTSALVPSRDWDPTRTSWDAGVPSCSVQGNGVATLPRLDPDPLLVCRAQGWGHCHGLVAWWENDGVQAGPCPGAPATLQLAALAALGLFSPLSKTSRTQ